MAATGRNRSRRRNTPETFLAELVDIDTGYETLCRLWPGSTSNGYGQLGMNCRVVRAHVIAWEIANGPVPKGHHLHHMCGITLCCNEEHLIPLTPDEHMIIHHWLEGHEVTLAGEVPISLVEVRHETARQAFAALTDRGYGKTDAVKKAVEVTGISESTVWRSLRALSRF